MKGTRIINTFDRLIALKLWDDSYSFTPINAKSASNIPARFQNEYQNDRYEIILVFCDTDKEPYREYAQIKRKINAFLGKRKAAEKLVIFANPCTMQIILLHFDEVSLRNQGKKTNSAEIERLTGIPEYDAHEDQIQELCRRITRSNYSNMKERAGAICYPDTVSGSTNISIFLDWFEKPDDQWIAEIRKACAQ